MSGENKSKFWEFVGDNVVALSTVVAGVGVIIWQAITNPTNLDPVSAAILALLSLLATSEIVERRKRLDKLQATVDERLAQLLAVLPVTEVRSFPDSDSAITYLSGKIRDADVSIDFASIDFVRSRAKGAHEKHRQVREQTIKRGKVRFRYLFRADENRNERVKALLRNSVAGKFFTAGFKCSAQHIPMMVFVIFDGQELFVRSPYEVGEEEIYLSIKQPDIISLFLQWFN